MYCTFCQGDVGADSWREALPVGIIEGGKLPPLQYDPAQIVTPSATVQAFHRHTGDGHTPHQLLVVGFPSNEKRQQFNVGQSL